MTFRHLSADCDHHCRSSTTLDRRFHRSWFRAVGVGLLAVSLFATATIAQEPQPDAIGEPNRSPLDLDDAPAPIEAPPAPAQQPKPPTEGAIGDEYLQLLIEADRLHQQGRFAEAEHLYRKAKGSFTGLEFNNRPEPIRDPALLPPAGQVYWREAAAGEQLNLPTRVLVPLQLLTEEYPEFIPGTIRYAQVLVEQERPEEALTVLERATALYPEQEDLVKTRVEMLAAQEQWLEASIAARQFTLFNPDAESAPPFRLLADDYLDRFQRALRGRLTGNAIANVVTGALSYALTGGLFGPLSAVDTAVLLLRGESEVGESAVRSAQRELDLVEDPEIVTYVNDIGQRLAVAAGRPEFEYEFYVIRDPELNAFALPGGKIFINAGAITQTRSEAELAGLIAHELAHAVLSHGFQLATTSNVTASVLLPIPYAGNIATDLTLFSYSRSMERQADILGTRILATAGYAADGLHNLMITLEQTDPAAPEWEWLSTHPDTEERVQNLEAYIQQNGYNRYTYEGVEPHQGMQDRVTRLLTESTDAVPKEE